MNISTRYPKQVWRPSPTRLCLLGRFLGNRDLVPRCHCTRERRSLVDTQFSHVAGVLPGGSCRRSAQRFLWYLERCAGVDRSRSGRLVGCLNVLLLRVALGAAVEALATP